MLVLLAGLVIVELFRGHRRDLLVGAPLLMSGIFGVAGQTVESASLQKMLFGAAAASFVWLALMRFLNGRRDAKVDGSRIPTTALVVLVGWALTVDLVIGLVPWSQLLPRHVVVVAVVVATVLLRQAGGLPPAAVASVALTLLGGSVLAGPLVATSWRECDKFKCGYVGALYTGPFPSENYLAMLAAFTLATVALGLSGRLRVFAATLCAVTIVATGSRAGMAVGAAVLLGALVFGWRRHRTSATGRAARAPVRRSMLLPLVVIGVIAYFGISLAMNASGADFSNRGRVWLYVLNVLAGHELFGVGGSSYEVFQDSGDVSRHFPHSQYLFLLFSGGYVLVALYVVWLASILRAHVRRWGLIAAAAPLAVAVNGLTEITWNPVAIDGLVWVALALTLLSTAPASTAPVEPDASSSMSRSGDDELEAVNPREEASSARKRTVVSSTFGDPSDSAPGTVFGHALPVTRRPSDRLETTSR